MLIDLWGETSLYHTVVEALFGISMTFIAHFGRHDACTAASGRDCRVLVLRGDPKRAPAYVQEMATSLFGDGLLRADQVPALRQATVLVGSLIDAYRPVRWPRIYLHQLRYRASLQHAYAAFANLLHGAWRNGTDAPEVGHDAARGVWIRRDRSQPGLHFDRRHLLSDEIAALESVTRPWLRVSRLHELSLVQQARLMRQTRLLAGIEGAGFVNQMLMPRGGITVILSPWTDGARAWQWAYGQYHAGRLVYICLNGAELNPPFARALGHLLNAVWYQCAQLPALPGGATLAASGAPSGTPDRAVCASRAVMRQARDTAAYDELIRARDDGDEMVQEDKPLARCTPLRDDRTPKATRT